jgi:drug/metabolite transporter (DMT)-like permease
MLWFLFAITATVILSFAFVIDKFVLSKLMCASSFPLMAEAIIGLVFVIAIYLSGGLTALGYRDALTALLGGLLEALTFLFYYKAVQQEEISRAISLFSVEPVFIAIIGAMWLGEVFTLQIYLGIILIVLGAILIERHASRIKINRAFWFMMLAAFSEALFFLIVKYLLGFAGYWTVFSYAQMGFAMTALPICYFSLRKTQSRNWITKHAVMFILLSETLTVVSILLISVASSLGSATLTNTVYQLQPPFVLAIALFLTIFYPKILKEDMCRTTLLVKLTAISMMVAGVLLITL